MNLREMMNKAKHLDVLQQEFPEWSFSSNIVEPFRTWKEKAEKCDEHFKAIVEMEQEITEYKEKAERFDAIKDMFPDFLEHGKEWKEKAESHKRLLDQLYEKDIALDLIMENLKGREKCRGIDQSPDVGVKFIVHPDFCPCHGTGTIVRDATPKEVREIIEEGFLGWGADEKGHWHMKSGAVLFMEEK